MVVHRKLRVAGVVLALASCGPAEGDDDDTTSSSDSSSSEGTSSGSTTDGCGELPLCDLCPDDTAQLCGTPCPTASRSCSNEIGDAMQCEGGTWTCIVHPPLGTGCNEVCVLADLCSEAGCSSGLTVALVADGDGFVAGRYELAAIVDGAAEDCTFTISTDPSECAIPPCVTESDCNALYLLTEAPMRIELAYGVVGSVDLTLTRDDAEIAHEAFTPAYDITAPNGPGCGPACAVASVEIAL